jgi:hypothetical protein
MTSPVDSSKSPFLADDNASSDVCFVTIQPSRSRRVLPEEQIIIMSGIAMGFTVTPHAKPSLTDAMYIEVGTAGIFSKVINCSKFHLNWLTVVRCEMLQLGTEVVITVQHADDCAELLKRIKKI